MESKQCPAPLHSSGRKSAVSDDILVATQTFDAVEARIQTQIHEHIQTLRTISPIAFKILTMTTTASTSLPDVDFVKIKLFMENGFKARAKELGLTIRSPKINRRSKRPPSSFHNSIALQCQSIGENRKRCIKIFNNSRLHLTRLHITGILSGADFVKTVNIASEMLSELTGGTRINIKTFDVNMLNLQFYVGRYLDLLEIKNTISIAAAKNPLICSVEYNRYAIIFIVNSFTFQIF